jgi:hypothetical protein
MAKLCGCEGDSLRKPAEGCQIRRRDKFPLLVVVFHGDRASRAKSLASAPPSTERSCVIKRNFEPPRRQNSVYINKAISNDRRRPIGMAELQKQLQVSSEEFQKSQSGTFDSPSNSTIGGIRTKTRSAELQTAVDARQKLESQQQENKGVQKARQNGFY